jgi:hypothetical protein
MKAIFSNQNWRGISPLGWCSATVRVASLSIVLLATGCAALFEDELDRAYQAGSISATEYHRLRIEQAAVRKQQEFQQQQAYQQQQQEMFAQQMQRLNAPPPAPLFSTPLIQRPPRTPTSVGFADDAQAAPQLPSGFELDQIQKGQGYFTGVTKFGSDGKMWKEYRLPSGTTYWSPGP